MPEPVRFITVLAVEIRGREALLDRLDPEEAEAALRFLLNAVAAVARDRGGRVDLRAAGFCAAFGWRRTTEADAEVAVEAALQIAAAAASFSRQHPGLGLAVGMGLHSGRQGVAPAGMAVAGPVAERAAGLAGEAPAGGVLASDETYRGACDRFDFRVHAEGATKAQADRVYRVAGPRLRSAYGVRFEGPLLGREPELAVVTGAAASLAGGIPIVLVVEGPPGIGKSRFCREAIKEFAARSCRVIDATAVGQPGESRLLALVRDLLGGPPDVPAIAAALADLEIADPDLAARWLAQHLVIEADPQLADVPPVVALERAHGILGCWVRAVAARGPCLIVGGDLRGADDSFRTWVGEFTAREQADEAIGLLLECRADGQWPLAIPEAGPRLHAVALGPLGADASLAWVAECLGLPPDPGTWPAKLASFAAPVLERAEGNPLFIAGLVRDLERQGVWERRADGSRQLGRIPERLALPATLGVLAAARLDALTSEARRVVDAAAILGRRFEYRLLEAVAGSGDLAAVLAALLQGGILVRESPDVLAFALSGDWEVACEAIGAESRRRLHAAAAAALERLAGEGGFDAAERLAVHFLEAGMPEHAIAYLLRAGQKAWAANRVTAARDAYRLARAICRDAPHSGAGDVLARLGEIESALGNRDMAIACWRELLETGDRRQRVVALLELGRYHEHALADFRGAQTFLERGLAQARAIGDRGREAEIVVELATVALRLGDFPAAVEVSEALLGGELAAQPALRGDLLSVRGAARLRLRDHAGAIADLRAGLAQRVHARDEADLEASLGTLRDSRRRDARLDDAILRSLNALGAACAEASRLEESEKALGMALEFSRRGGRLDRRAMVLNNLGDLQMRLGRFEVAARYFEEGAATYEQAANRRGETIALANLGEAWLRLGDRARSVAYLERACKLAESCSYHELLADIEAMLDQARQGSLP